MKRITKEVILKHISPMDIFRYYFRDDFKLGVAYKSPFRKERNASFNIYKNEKGNLIYKDFAYDTGDCFGFVMKKFDINFSEALSLIATDFNIQNLEGLDEKINNDYNYDSVKMKKKGLDTIRFNDNKDHKIIDYIEKIEPLKEDLIIYTCTICNPTKNNYFSDKYMISHETLKQYNLTEIKEVKWFSRKAEREITVVGTPDNPIYMMTSYDFPANVAVPFNSFAEMAEIKDPLSVKRKNARFYMPMSKSKALKHFGSVSRKNFFGKRKLNDAIKKRKK